MLSQKCSTNGLNGATNVKHPNNCDQHQHLHLQHQEPPQQQQLSHSQNISWSRRGSYNSLASIPLQQAQQTFNALGSERRKSSLSYQQQQQQQQQQHQHHHQHQHQQQIQQQHQLSINNDIAVSDGLREATGNEYFLAQAKLASTPLCSTASPVTSSIERYEESLACCLPPPSPAPNSDHFLDDADLCMVPSQQHQTLHQQLHQSASSNSLGVSSSCSSTNNNLSNNNTMLVLSHNHQHQQQHQQHPKYLNNSGHQLLNNCPIELTSTLRHRLTIGNYRDNCINSSSSSQNSSGRFIPHATHYLDISGNSNINLTPSDTYAYLTSTVHTPVKRYVPTPPPPQEFYANETLQQQPQEQTQPHAPSSIIGSKSTNSCIGQQQQQQQQQLSLNNLTYRMQRMKCCSNDSNGPTNQSIPDYNVHGSSSLPPNNIIIRDELCSSSSNRTRNHNNSNNLKLSNNNGELSGSNGGVGGVGGIGSGGGQTTPLSQFITASDRDSPLMIFQDGQQQQQASFNMPGLNSGPSYSSLGSLPINGITNATSNPLPSRHTVSTINRANNNTSPACFLNELNDCSTNVSTRKTDDEMNASSIIGGGSSNSITGSSSTLATTCLHCKTVRRITGVHQTTQTTGPISPIPVLTPGPLSNNSSNSGRLQVESQYQQSAVVNTVQQKDPNKIVVNAASSNSPNSNGTNLAFEAGIKAKKFNLNNDISQTEQHDYNSSLQANENNSGILNLETAELSGNILRNKTSLGLQHHNGLQISQQQPMQRYSTKQRLLHYMNREISRFFGVDSHTELEDYHLWQERQRRLALRRFGVLKMDSDFTSDLHDPTSMPYHQYGNGSNDGSSVNGNGNNGNGSNHYHSHAQQHQSFYQERPDILPAHDTADENVGNSSNLHQRQRHHDPHNSRYLNAFDFRSMNGGTSPLYVERKASVISLIISFIHYLLRAINNHQVRYTSKQWSRSFVPAHIRQHIRETNQNDIYEEVAALQEQEIFFDTPLGNDQQIAGGNGSVSADNSAHNDRLLYLTERGHGWRTSNLITSSHAQNCEQTPPEQQSLNGLAAHCQNAQHQQQQAPSGVTSNIRRGCRISSQLLDSVLENSRRPLAPSVKLLAINDLDNRNDHRPFFTYWINTVQILVLILSLLCYGLAPMGLGVEQRSGQVLVTSLSLQTVQHQEPRNVWIGPRNNDLVHIGAKLATCMRRDLKIMEVIIKTRRHERETACCIRNDDSGCVQSSQADCSVRGLYPTKSISTWKKWSPGESGPGGRISGSVCGLDPKYCDAPASIAPYEWPDDITKWPICRKTNSFSQRFRFKDHTAEHMVCEVIGHPCCSGVYGECRITTREYCDFINGYFHEEASLCSQVSCLSNVCGMFPFLNVEVPDQFYRLFTSLCIHAGIMHLAITVIFQHLFLADLERLMGSIRTAILYIGSGLAGNLTSAILMPYKPEVGPLASLSGVVAALVVLLTLIHWQQLHKPHMALFKLLIMTALLFGLGTLPWQLNFAGLLAGIFCGVFLTIALVPFVSIYKYRRKAKINLIWSCLIFHLFIYATMLLIFYMFPTELTKLNFGEVFINALDNNNGKGDTNNINGGNGGGNGDSDTGIGGVNNIGTHIGSTNLDILRGTGLSSTNGINNNHFNNNNRHTYLHQQQQYHYHHHSDDIISNGVSAASTTLLQ